MGIGDQGGRKAPGTGGFGNQVAGHDHNILAAMAMKWALYRATFTSQSAPEVPVGPGYVADAVVVGGLQNRFFVDYCKHWGLAPQRVYPGVSSNGEAVFATSGNVPCYFAHIFEAKASRADFLATFGKGPRHANRLLPVGTTHWVVANAGVCEPGEVPEFWGLLVRAGRGLREIKRPAYCPISELGILRIEHAMFWKQDAQCWWTGDRWPRRSSFRDGSIEGPYCTDARPILDRWVKEFGCGVCDECWGPVTTSGGGVSVCEACEAVRRF